MILCFVSASISSENIAFGGERFATFMVYLNSVEAGGNTIFPQAGISSNVNKIFTEIAW